MSSILFEPRRREVAVCVHGLVQEMVQLYSNNGSEASLVQNDSKFLSVSASKRTLSSLENITEPVAPVKSALQSDDSSGSFVKVESVLCNSEKLNETQTRSPSYLKLSRAIGGYTPYNTYVSSTDQDRLRNSERNDTKNKTSSFVTQKFKETQVVLQNGDAAVIAIKLPHQQTLGYGSTQNNADSLVNHASTSSFAINATNAPVSCNGTQNVEVSAVNIMPCIFLPDDACLSVSNVPYHMQHVSQTQINGELNINAACKHEDTTNNSDSNNKENTLIATDSPQKDAQFFLALVEKEELRLQEKCERTEQDLISFTSEEADGKMRAAVGKANLLIKKKFQQFRELCRSNMVQNETELFQTTIQDLTGFWEMVLLQVSDIDKMFEEIEKLRQMNWTAAAKTPDSTPSSSKLSGGAKKKGTTTGGTNSKSASPSLTAAAAKARQEARQRLMAAKVAGRQRKASESDKDVEIYIS